jgi:hypothetical protein
VAGHNCLRAWFLHDGSVSLFERRRAFFFKPPSAMMSDVRRVRILRAPGCHTYQSVARTLSLPIFLLHVTIKLLTYCFNCFWPVIAWFGWLNILPAIPSLVVTNLPPLWSCNNVAGINRKKPRFGTTDLSFSLAFEEKEQGNKQKHAGLLFPPSIFIPCISVFFYDAAAVRATMAYLFVHTEEMFPLL